MTVKERLINYYSKNSKHSNYQVLPSSLRRLLGTDEVQTRTRFEVERLRYILDKIDVGSKSVLDIGGNTGFFIFELIEAGARSAHLYEGNKAHSEFVRLATEALGLSDKIRVTNRYFSFDSTYDERYDIVLLFNVLHHVGDDYGDKSITIEKARTHIIQQLNSLKNMTNTVVFQLGYNWQGKSDRCLFANGTKAEMIEFIEDGVQGVWRIAATGTAQRTVEGINYKDLNDTNIKRDDTMGEFLNRPIFILESEST